VARINHATGEITRFASAAKAAVASGVQRRRLLRLLVGLTLGHAVAGHAKT
jgi:hypothetical protein